MCFRAEKGFTYVLIDDICTARVVAQCNGSLTLPPAVRSEGDAAGPTAHRSVNQACNPFYLPKYGQAVTAEYPIAPNMPSYVPSNWSNKSVVFQWFAETRENSVFSDKICHYAHVVYNAGALVPGSKNMDTCSGLRYPRCLAV